MAQVKLHETGDSAGARWLSTSEAQPFLQATGAELGQWAAKATSVSSAPQLAYARELLGMQRRFGTVLSDRVTARPGRPPAQQPWLEPERLHAHDDDELRVVVGGTGILHLPLPKGGTRLSLHLAPGDWFVLPAGLRHRIELGARPSLDLLRLFTRPREAVLPIATVIAA